MAVRLKYILLFLCVVLSCCSHFAFAEEAGFTADVSGAVETQISGPGLFFAALAYESRTVKHPGYHVIADAGGVRENGITFTIPLGQQGACPLVDGSPFEIGEHCGVRLESGSTTDYFNKQTSGTLHLISLPRQPGDGVAVQGEFQFEVSNSQGKRVKVKGQFNFIPQDKATR